MRLAIQIVKGHPPTGVFQAPPQLDAPHQHDLTRQRDLSGGGAGSPGPEVTLNDHEASCLASPYPTCCLAGRRATRGGCPGLRLFLQVVPREAAAFQLPRLFIFKGMLPDREATLPFHGLFPIKKDSGGE